MDNQRRLAIHEASHCLIAGSQGLAYGARIFGNSGIAGSGDIATPPDAAEYTSDKLEKVYSGASLQSLLSDSVLTAAGCVGESLARFDPVAIPSYGDRQMLIAGFRSAFPDCQDFDAERAWCALACGLARDILRRRWAAVEKVAAVLIAHGVCDAETVKQIMDDNP